MNHGERVLQPEARASNMAMMYKKSYVHYEPLGVVAAIVSWNYRAFSTYFMNFPPTFISSAQCLVTHPSCDIFRKRYRLEML